MALRTFSGDELILNAEQTKTALLIFWPTKGSDIGSMAVNDSDRSFAQGLMVEAIDASLKMGLVEAIFRSAYKPNATAQAVIKAVVWNIITKSWLSNKKLDPNTSKIYDAVRATLARNFRTAFELRLSTGEYI